MVLDAKAETRVAYEQALSSLQEATDSAEQCGQAIEVARKASAQSDILAALCEKFAAAAGVPVESGVGTIQ
jgi:hypothetical protein